MRELLLTRVNRHEIGSVPSRLVMSCLALAVGAGLAACGSTVSGTGHLGAQPTPSSVSSSQTTSASPPTSESLSFHDVTISNPTDLTRPPGVSCASPAAISDLLYRDLVVGAGTAATPESTVTVQYLGVLYREGTTFDSTWDRGQSAQFALQQTITGFRDAVGGTSAVPAMRVGGRRVMILPARLAYGSTGTGPIPADATLVFVVDLVDTA